MIFGEGTLYKTLVTNRSLLHCDFTICQLILQLILAIGIFNKYKTCHSKNKIFTNVFCINICITFVSK
jgi:hypothetical protein